MSNNRKRYTCTRCGCWFVTESDYKNHLKTHIVKPKAPKEPSVNPESVLFPYSEQDQKPRLVHCKNSGSGNIWCYPVAREKYGKLCELCGMNPDKNLEAKPKTGLDIYD